MIQIQLIGNLTRDPETRSTPDGKQVCNFTVAVSSHRSLQPVFVQVSAWGKLGENCQKYLLKGRKVFVQGEAYVSAYQKKDGTSSYNLRVGQADKVKFLTTAAEAAMENDMPSAAGDAAPADDGGYMPVDPGDELPWF